MNCKSCAHWNALARFTDGAGRACEAGPGNQSGECRCRPPSPAQSAAGNWRVFPVTRELDCCGQWSASEFKATVVEVKPPGITVIHPDRVVRVEVDELVVPAAIKPKKALTKKQS